MYRICRSARKRPCSTWLLRTTYSDTHRSVLCSRTMAALDLSRVLAQSNKALQLMYVDGHYGRAATKFAAAVGPALGPAAGEDCLVVTTLQVNQVHALALHSFTCKLPVADTADALHLAFFTVLPAAQRALLRRKAAGTLLGGTCRLHEVAWKAAILKANDSRLGHQINTAAYYSAVAQLVGYDAFLFAACCVLKLIVLSKARTGGVDGADFVAHATFYINALRLMAAPCRGRAASPALVPLDTTWIGPEASIVQGMQELGLDELPIFGSQIQAAWRALQRSGALEERRLLTEGAPNAARNSAKTAAAAAAAAAPERLRACALGSCGVRETYPAQHKLCGACAAVVYCCREHPLADWPAHTAACKAACKAARAAKDAAKQR